jgi:ferredoxin, 2Fe-2S
VKEGADLISEMEDDEADKLDMAADLQLNSRLGCQTVIKKPGKLVVEIPRGTGITFPKSIKNPLFAVSV